MAGELTSAVFRALQLVEQFARSEDDDSQGIVDVQATQARNGGRLPMPLTILVVSV